MKAKPIFICSISHHLYRESGDEMLLSQQANLNKALNGEYHVLITVHNTDEDTKFECFNAPDLDEKGLEELKEIIKNMRNVPIN